MKYAEIEEQVAILDNMLQYPRKRNHEGLSMKHKVTVLLSVALIVVTSLLAVSAYHNYKHSQAAQAHVAAIVQASKQKAANAQAAINKVRLNQLKAQCAKDHAAYVAETPAQRTTSKLTDCDPSLQLVQ